MRDKYGKPIIEIIYMAEEDILRTSGEGSGTSGEGAGDGFIDDPFE